MRPVPWGPVMRVLLQTAGVGVATILAARLLFPAAGRRRYMLACLTIAAGVTVPLAFGSMADQFRAMDVNRLTAGAQRQVNFGGQRVGVNTDFTDFALARMRG